MINKESVIITTKKIVKNKIIEKKVNKLNLLIIIILILLLISGIFFHLNYFYTMLHSYTGAISYIYAFVLGVLISIILVILTYIYTFNPDEKKNFIKRIHQDPIPLSLALSLLVITGGGILIGTLLYTFHNYIVEDNTNIIAKSIPYEYINNDNKGIIIQLDKNIDMNYICYKLLTYNINNNHIDNNLIDLNYCINKKNFNINTLKEVNKLKKEKIKELEIK